LPQHARRRHFATSQRTTVHLTRLAHGGPVAIDLIAARR
jgi:hypothetical protein